MSQLAPSPILWGALEWAMPALQDTTGQCWAVWGAKSSEAGTVLRGCSNLCWLALVSGLGLPAGDHWCAVAILPASPSYAPWLEGRNGAGNSWLLMPAGW